jgi:hypothetical protein
VAGGAAGRRKGKILVAGGREAFESPIGGEEGKVRKTVGRGTNMKEVADREEAMTGCEEGSEDREVPE